MVTNINYIQPGSPTNVQRVKTHASGRQTVDNYSYGPNVPVNIGLGQNSDGSSRIGAGQSTSNIGNNTPLISFASQPAASSKPKNRGMQISFNTQTQQNNNNNRGSFPTINFGRSNNNNSNRSPLSINFSGNDSGNRNNRSLMFDLGNGLKLDISGLFGQSNNSRTRRNQNGLNISFNSENPETKGQIKKEKATSDGRLTRTYADGKVKVFDGGNYESTYEDNELISKTKLTDDQKKRLTARAEEVYNKNKSQQKPEKKPTQTAKLPFNISFSV